MLTHPSTDSERFRQWVETWKRAGPELEEIRRREIEAADTHRRFAKFSEFAALTNLPPRTTSGLIEQQARFARLRAKK